ncbi:indolepyruvate oxidoreductase subunit beta family protein [Sphingoaurantiacus capsulatus]|uniref:Indolepyruvate oxidoreductase subunit beta family protein n=1 Tax=Sphingoaurantiacus capsulatus TaxID=1771310 RepID=A0ABV7XE32_9SPHN
MTARITTIAINAMGGHGGGVLADWIAETAEAEGYFAQITSVPGFAQRSGATIYYVEIYPRAGAPAAPVFALMAVPGHTDIVIASELAEGGRSVLRGLVTPDRTTLITSSHREYTTEEKLSRFDGRRDSTVVFDNCVAAAKRFVAFDMREISAQAGCPLSAVLFGTLAGAAVLPFARDAFERTIRHGGIAVAANLRGFATGYDRAVAGTQSLPDVEVRTTVPEAPIGTDLAAEVRRRFPAQLHDLLDLAVARLIEYQGAGYARRYLDRLQPIVATDTAGRGYALSLEVARLLALRMAHEDVIRVADIKTRRRRFASVASENRLVADGTWDVTEFLAPRPEEAFDLLPASIGKRLAASPLAHRMFGKLLHGGFTIRTSRLRGFLLLYVIARLRGLRPYSLGQQIESRLIDEWLDLLRGMSADYALALSTAQLLTLVRGYGSTLERGRQSYHAIVAALSLLIGHADAAERVDALREAALADEDGKALDRAIDALSQSLPARAA